MLAIAKRNGLAGTLEGYAEGEGEGKGDEAWCAAQRAKRSEFASLQPFLDLYYAGCDVLKTERDFYDLGWAYLVKASARRNYPFPWIHNMNARAAVVLILLQMPVRGPVVFVVASFAPPRQAAGVARAEIFFDPQTHTVERQQLPLATVVNGLHRACADAATKLDPPVDAALIMCFLRHRHPGCAWASPPAPAGEAMGVLERALRDHRAQLLGVGLDSSEAGNPPALFRDVFARAREARRFVFRPPHPPPHTRIWNIPCCCFARCSCSFANKLIDTCIAHIRPRPACAASRTRARKAPPPTSPRRSTPSGASASTTAYAASRTRPWSSASRKTRSRSRPVALLRSSENFSR